MDIARAQAAAGGAQLMANNEEHQVKEAFEAIHLPNDIAARTLASIEAKREQRKSGRIEELMAAQESTHANKPAGQEGKVVNKPSEPQAKGRGAPFLRNAAKPCVSPKAGASPRLRRAWRLSRAS